MVTLVQPLLADAVINGMAVFSIAFVGYLFWLRFREGREQRKLLRDRARFRRNHWGYE
ncbi:MAG TPA: hypothetical protein P5205_16310 [Candidatus Paceibacterota bacterium]|nr:hypothetical protein [Verrucomicrobiota bacterium]HSA11925.1 hypothetical protein [Candidatus Paceibacterota bacterium]